MGFLLLLPFLFIRFGLLALLGKGAVARAAYFAPLIGKEKQPIGFTKPLTPPFFFTCSF